MKMSGITIQGRAGMSQTASNTDPYFANVSLLLHLDGTNGSTTFTDSSGSPKTVTRSGTSAALDTSNAKFGTAGLTQTSGGLITDSYPGFTFGTGDFTVEGWFNPNNQAGTPMSFDTRANGAGFGLYLSVFGSGKLGYASNSQVEMFGTITIPNNVYTYIALTRQSGTVRMFVNGVLDNSVTDSRNMTGDIMRMGFDGTFNLTGSFDELRVTKGVARYTATFTPPTGPFPNS